MKRIFIIHGWGGNPAEGWIDSIVSELEEMGFSVQAPEMPNPVTPTIDSWTNKIKELVEEPDDETYFIGHSMGCQAILRYMESLPKGKKVGGAVLVAPWFNLTEQSFDEEYTKETAQPWLSAPIDLEKIKSHSQKFVGIVSDNDPYVPLSDKDILKQKLGAEIVLLHEKGHLSVEDDVNDLSIALIKLTNLMSM
jgi:predicted alpha/beta hydrolase family esterase